MSTPPLFFRPPTESGDPASRPAAIPAELLFQGSQEILIGHNGDTYRLRITRNGKLILTK
ncbi:MAG: hemin uptake protein HemP [Thiobacillus sp.]